MAWVQSWFPHLLARCFGTPVHSVSQLLHGNNTSTLITGLFCRLTYGKHAKDCFSLKENTQEILAIFMEKYWFANLEPWSTGPFLAAASHKPKFCSSFSIMSSLTHLTPPFHNTHKNMSHSCTYHHHQPWKNLSESRKLNTKNHNAFLPCTSLVPLGFLPEREALPLLVYRLGV